MGNGATSVVFVCVSMEVVSGSWVCKNARFIVVQFGWVKWVVCIESRSQVQVRVTTGL